MPTTTAHIINHTHWDREWFLTSVYTSRWIGGLIDRLVELVEANPNFHFLLDGQTLVIEDLLDLAPEYRERVDRLVRGGNLLIGPYYCQPDWRLTSGEALVRNLLYGAQDMARHHGGMDTGWLVDTFGHISQAPQLHRLFSIGSVYIWRGAPQMEPYFRCCGADGTELFTINLFGGYRNLYGVTHAPQIAGKRLQAEVEKLRGYYPTPDIPLFDGYDLEDNPEDPVRFYQSQPAGLPTEVEIREATPVTFSHEIAQKLKDLPVVAGELLSGKFGAVFPGTLSARTYLKLMARDCEQALFQVCEPLGALSSLFGRPYPAEQYEAWGRLLLQNAVHDCICGVSIDQVHEKMEYSYRQVFDGIQADIRASLASLLHEFAPGLYAVSTSPFPYDGWQPFRDRLYHVRTRGVGVWEIADSLWVEQAGEAVETFDWQNAYYEARVEADGTVTVGDAVLGKLVIREERGDTYSDEGGQILGGLTSEGPLVVQRSERHCVLAFTGSASWEGIQVSARVRLTFDSSPLIRWQIELDSRGTDFRVEVLFETGQSGEILAGMPFDQVLRPPADEDLLPRQLDDHLNAVLLGQRELGATETFPFHDYVAVSDGSASAVVLAKGLHAYQATDDGRITLHLRRAVEWLTRPNLENRVGDAGPFFYVPDARCERAEVHELAVLFADYGVEDPRLQAANAAFQNPPLLVDVKAAGERTSLAFWEEPVPLSSLHRAGERLLARAFNPTTRPWKLTRAYRQTDVFGKPQSEIAEVPPKAIVTLEVPTPEGWSANPPGVKVDTASVKWLNPLAWRVGSNQGLPDPAVIQQLKDKIARQEQQIDELASRPAPPGSREHYLWQHQLYVLERELLEYQLSAYLNERKRAMQGKLTYEYLYEPDAEIDRIGRRLNALRIKRRIYDYIIQAV